MNFPREMQRGDMSRFPDGRTVLVCPNPKCRHFRTTSRARPCENCGEKMQARVVYNLPDEALAIRR
jgi:hypothetical protein